MHGRMIKTIFRKDLIDAIRDSRVLVAIIVPLAIGLIYNFVFKDTTPKPSATVAYTTAEETTLPELLKSAAGDSVKLTFKQQPDAAAVRNAIDHKDADIGLIIPAGFEQAVKAGQQPVLTVIQRDPVTSGGAYVAAALTPALRQLAGQAPPAKIESSASKVNPSNQSVFERLGLRTYFVLVMVIFLIAMICLLAVPTILADETEKKTLDALVMVASYGDVIVSKALVGLCYIVVASALLINLTRLRPSAPVTFVGSLLLLSLAMLGLGLLLGQLFKNANQLNTWSGFLLAPMVAPAYLVGFDMPHVVNILLDILPTSQATRLAMNGLSGETLFANAWLSVLVIIAWAVAAYGILLWRLSRREG